MEPFKINVEVSLSDQTLEALARIIGELRGESRPAETQAPAPAAPQPVIRNAAPEAAPAAPAAPAETQAPAPAQAAATADDVRVAVRNARTRAGKAEPVKAVLKKYDAGNVSELKASDYSAVINDLNAL